MHEDNRFLNELFRIVNGALRLDTNRVRNYTAFLAEKLESSGDQPAANRLRKMLEETDQVLRPTAASMARSLPSDTETRFPLIERVDVKSLDEPPVVLSDTQEEVVNEYLSIIKSQSQLEAHGVHNSATLLLYGPSGCGKSRLVRHIARELGLPLFIARLDGLISSFLGSTSKNVRSIFEFASSNPCILFLDEFDAIAKLRDDRHELGELKRVVNSFLQNLDSLGMQSLVIAATNHHSLLDAAVWRRFNYRIELGFPDAALRMRMWSLFLAPIIWPEKDIKLLIDLSDGMSGSDIQEVTFRLKRKRLAFGVEPQLRDAFVGMLQLALGEGEERRYLAAIARKNPGEIARALRKRDPRLFSHANIAALLGVSKATAYRLTTKGGSNRVRTIRRTTQVIR
jgi:SpoVK/Ycf46/Vps4 family AAA+-type ATPase